MDFFLQLSEKAHGLGYEWLTPAEKVAYCLINEVILLDRNGRRNVNLILQQYKS